LNRAIFFRASPGGLGGAQVSVFLDGGGVFELLAALRALPHALILQSKPKPV
jgi:hypothetical protein